MENIQNLYIDMYTYEFSSDKDLKKFINSCKRLVRSSYEYNEWTKYIKLTKGFSQCQFTHESIYELTVEIHHHPYSMESLTSIVIDTLMNRYQKICTFDVAKEVIQMHYEDEVGYVLLVKSLHEKFHNGFLQIPIELANGKWQSIPQKYSIPEEVSKLVDTYKSITTQNVSKLKWNNDYILYDDGEQQSNSVQSIA